MQRAVKTTTTALMTLAGLAMGITAATAHGTDLRSQRVQDLKSLVLVRANDALFAEHAVATLRDDVNQLAVTFSSPELRKVRGQISKLQRTTALTPLNGAGLMITLNDAKPTADWGSDFDPNWLLVHQQDIEAVVNALWRGPARGITVMGQRISSTSAVRCVGSTVLVNGRVFAPPFVIKAVGNPDLLLSALANDKQVRFFRDLARTFGLTYEVEQAPAMYLPAFEGSYSAQFAQPLHQ